ncbi:hypothetical protein VTH06DRAFT_2588 [Thermothelomyces fergusii]
MAGQGTSSPLLLAGWGYQHVIACLYVINHLTLCRTIYRNSLGLSREPCWLESRFNQEARTWNGMTTTLIDPSSRNQSSASTLKEDEGPKKENIGQMRLVCNVEG